MYSGNGITTRCRILDIGFISRFKRVYVMRDLLYQQHHGLGRKPVNTKKIRHGWCTFCKESHPLENLIRGIGYLCPTCGGCLMGNHPGIERHFYRG